MLNIDSQVSHIKDANHLLSHSVFNQMMVFVNEIKYPVLLRMSLLTLQFNRTSLVISQNIFIFTFFHSNPELLMPEQQFDRQSTVNIKLFTPTVRKQAG